MERSHPGALIFKSAFFQSEHTKSAADDVDALENDRLDGK
jgi:hypothetical protein